MGLPRFDFALVSEAPGVLRTDTGIPITVEHGLERLAALRHRLDHRLGALRPRPVPGAARRVPRGPRPGRHDHQPLHRGVRAGRRGPAGRQAGHHALEVGRRAGRPLPGGARRPVGPLRGQRAGHHRGGHGRRRGHPAAPRPPGVGRGRGQRPRPRDGRAPAPRRRAGPVHRRPRAGLPGRPARRRPRVGRRAPRRGHQRGHARPPCADEPAQLRPTVQGDHRARRRTPGCSASAWPRPRRCSRRRDAPVEEIARLVGFGTAAGLREQFARRRGVSPRAYRQTFRAGARSGPGRRRCSSTGTGGAGRVGSDQTLVEAEFGQPA